MKLVERWNFLYKHLWLIILLMILGGGSAAYSTSQQGDIYEASTTLYINPYRVSPIVPGEAIPLNNEPQTTTLVHTYRYLMRTRSFIERVEAEIDDEEVSAYTVFQSLSTRYTYNTQFFHISATHTDPDIAQEIANTAAEVLIARELDRQELQQQREEQQNSQIYTEPDQIEQWITSLEIELDYYNNEIQRIEQAISELRDEPDTPQNDQRLDSLFTELNILRSKRLDVQQQLVEAQQQNAIITGTAAGPPGIATIVDAAQAPTAPLPRNSVQRILLAIGASMVIGGVLAFLLEYIDRTIKSPDMLETIYGLPVQGVIGITHRKHLKNQNEMLVSLHDNRSSTAESLRVLRTGIQVANLDMPLRSILITSAGPGEGKTFIAANLAASLAYSGHRVILVDTDLRKPRLHQVFELSHDRGFTNMVVNQQQNVIDSLHQTSIKNLQVMTCGVVPPNPAELLVSQRVRDLMQQIATHADIVIYDSPPATTVTDATILAQHVDAVIHVIRAGSTPINHVLHCKTMLTQVGAPIFGTVLNQVRVSDLSQSSYYYYYHYHQEYGDSANGPLWRKLLRGGKKKRDSQSAHVSP